MVKPCGASAGFAPFVRELVKELLMKEQFTQFGGRRGGFTSVFIKEENSLKIHLTSLQDI